MSRLLLICRPGYGGDMLSCLVEICCLLGHHVAVNSSTGEARWVTSC